MKYETPEDEIPCWRDDPKIAGALLKSWEAQGKTNEAFTLDIIAVKVKNVLAGIIDNPEIALQKALSAHCDDEENLDLELWMITLRKVMLSNKAIFFRNLPKELNGLRGENGEIICWVYFIQEWALRRGISRNKVPMLMETLREISGVTDGKILSEIVQDLLEENSQDGTTKMREMFRFMYEQEGRKRAK